VLALLLLLSLQRALASAQPNYWTALNFRVTFYGNGTVLVEELLHPFTAEGRSLFEDKEVERHLRNSTGEFLNYALLMFTDRPDRILYRAAFRMDKKYGERVYCDVSGTGTMKEFLGAYVFPVLIYLNLSTFVTPLGDDTYQVRVRDSFTSSDPRSWVDVIEFRFEGAQLINYTWAPAYAKGPVEDREGRLVWRNHNELEAPDYYIFTLRLPGLKFEGAPPEVSAVIREVILSGTTLTVLVENTGLTSGYAVVWVRGTWERGLLVEHLGAREEDYRVITWWYVGEDYRFSLSGVQKHPPRLVDACAPDPDYGVSAGQACILDEHGQRGSGEDYLPNNR